MDAIRPIPATRPRWRRCGRTAIAALLATCLVAAPAGAVVYKWLDPQGNVHYSDRPPPPDGKLVAVENFAAPARVTAAPTAAAPVTPTAAEPAANDPAQLKQAVAQDVANAHSEQCKQAQARYQTYIQSRRLFKEGPNKERVYLTDAELETERINAKRDADESCDAASGR